MDDEEQQSEFDWWVAVFKEECEPDCISVQVRRNQEPERLEMINRPYTSLLFVWNSFESIKAVIHPLHLRFLGIQCRDIQVYSTSSNNAKNALFRFYLGPKIKIFDPPNSKKSFQDSFQPCRRAHFCNYKHFTTWSILYFTKT